MREPLRRQFTRSQWSYTQIGLWVDSGGVAHYQPLVGSSAIRELWLVRIAAYHNGGAVAGGNSVLRVAAYDTGAAVLVGSTLTLATALTAYTEANVSITGAKIDSSNDMLRLELSTDGGHRQIFATAWFAERPLRD